MKEAPDERLCRNCGSPVDEHYCPRCGQKYGSTHISWRSLYDEIVSLFVGDSLFGETGEVPRYGILQTLWRIIRHPAVSIGEFFAGMQRKYVSPLTLLLLICTLCLLALTLFDIKLMDYSPEDDGDRLESLFQQVSEFLSTHLEVIALIKLPILALACGWVFRRAPHLRYIEYFYIGLYLASLHMLLRSGTAILVHVCSISPESLTHDLLERAVPFVIFCYYVIVIQYLLQRSWRQAIFGCFLCSALTFVLILAACIVPLIIWSEITGEF